MKIKFYTDEKGTTCDKCGQGIKNIYVIEDNGISLQVGTECINKVCNVSDYGKKIIKKYHNRVKQYEKKIK